jgi:signal transduction histidine kinase
VVVRRLAAAYEDRAIDTSRLESVMARVDPVLLDSVLHNIIENSLKYGDPDGQVIVVSCEEEGFALAEVVDDGPGLTDPQRDLMFEKFHTLDETSGDRGTGLGLSIARGFVEAMGGTVRALPRRDGERGLRMSVRLRLDTLS